MNSKFSYLQLFSTRKNYTVHFRMDGIAVSAFLKNVSMAALRRGCQKLKNVLYLISSSMKDKDIP